ncbi:hypothetical protein [Actinomadura barringtoniae]|uniref:hypothetical protein n=1 Tax=Actinomadura barringtoniae TaxID=1427535 RepID=UPI001FB7DCE5|nr:hypothetical protein [Actinomadura barringtoniae]
MAVVGLWHDDRSHESGGLLHATPVHRTAVRHRRDVLAHPAVPAGDGARTDGMAAAADARTLKAELVGFDPIDGTEVVQILGAGTLVAALIGRQQRLPQPGRRLAVHFVERAYLRDDVGQRDTVGQAVRLDPTRAEQRPALIVDLSSDLSGVTPSCQAMRAYATRDVRLFPRGVRHRFRPPHR